MMIKDIITKAMHISKELQQQQGLSREHLQSQRCNVNYPPNESPKLCQQNYLFSKAPVDSPMHINAVMRPMTKLHYRSESPQYPQQHQHLPYNNTYNVPLIGDRMPSSNNMVRGQASSFYGNRGRYFPYQQSIPPHSIRGMYTPAGQQLIPSSVLHYPPRSSSYKQKKQYTLPPHSRQQLSQSNRSTIFGCNESQFHKHSGALELEFAKTTPSSTHLLSHLIGFDSCTSTQISPSSIVSPTISQNKTRSVSTDFDFYKDTKRHQHMNFQQKLYKCSRTPSVQTFSTDKLSTEYFEKTQQIAPSAHQLPVVSSELLTMRENAQFSTRVNHDNQQHTNHLTHLIVGNDITASIASSSNTSSISSSPLAASRDCLTTTPPLITATETDSGISVSSSCTRIRSDSTHSTSVYNGEYPHSVGSSSGLSYHCSEIKHLEEFNREKKESTTIQVFNENTTLKLKQEDTIHESNEGRGMQGSSDKGISYNMNESENKKNYGDYKNSLYDADALASCDSRENSNTSLTQKKNVPTKTSAGESNILPAKDSKHILEKLTFVESPTKILKIEGKSKENIEEKYVLQLNMCNEQKQTNKQIGNMSADLVNNGYIPPGNCLYFDDIQFKQQELPSPTPPAPPQNSPVDYCHSTSLNMNAFGYIGVPSTQLKPPSTGAAAAAAAAVVAAAAAAAAASIRTNKNRIIESDLITSRKAKRKINFLSGNWKNDNEECETNESNRKNKDMTPLPGFQQAFGSTEIGRFFEKFLFSPPDFHNSNDGYEGFDVGDQLQQQELNQIQQQNQHPQQQEYFNRKYTENNTYQTQRLHPRFPHPHLHYRQSYYEDQSYPFQITEADNYRDVIGICGRPTHSLYDLPLEYHSSLLGSCSHSSPYEMPLNVRSAFGSSCDRIGYNFGIKNSNYNGIRCNGY